MACRRVRRAGVGVELPSEVGDLPVCTGFDFLLVLFDPAVVDWTAFGFFRERARAGNDGGWGCVPATEGLLPAWVMCSGLAGPAVGVGCTGVSTIDGVGLPRSRAIASLSQRITWPQ